MTKKLTLRFDVEVPDGGASAGPAGAVALARGMTSAREAAHEALVRNLSPWSVRGYPVKVQNLKSRRTR